MFVKKCSRRKIRLSSMESDFKKAITIEKELLQSEINCCKEEKLTFSKEIENLTSEMISTSFLQNQTLEESDYFFGSGFSEDLYSEEVNQTKKNPKILISKILDSARQKQIDLHVDVGSADSFRYDDLEESDWRYLIILYKQLFVQCTESPVHETAKNLLSASFTTKQNKGSSKTFSTDEKGVPYFHKYTCGNITNKHMDSCLHVVPYCEPIVAGEVGYYGQSLSELLLLCANYLISASRIEFSVGFWICPGWKTFQAKIFILGRLLEKCPKQYSKLKEAVVKKDQWAFSDECDSSQSKLKFDEIDINQLNCILLSSHDFTDQNLDTDYIYQKKFTDIYLIQRTFKITFLASYKRQIFNLWTEARQ